MSFDIFLIASDRTPSGPAFEQRLKAVLEGDGAGSGDGVTHRLDDGGEIDIYADEQSVMFSSFGGLAKGACRLIHDVADALEMFIAPAGEVAEAYRTSGNRGTPPEDFLAVKPVSTADELGRRLLS
jgi:hypothetical protein